jgi:hypothetical protein
MEVNGKLHTQAVLGQEKKKVPGKHWVIYGAWWVPEPV